jgi:uncharacterized membrane protein
MSKSVFNVSLNKKNYQLPAKVVILILHFVGILGLFFEFSRYFFQWMTPFHLLTITAILLFFHRDWGTRFWVFAGFAFSVGMVSEIVGVKTGLVFGEYQYGTVLGPDLFGVPLMIGMNWFLLVYLTGGVFSYKIGNDFLAATAGALLMVLMDFNLEPVAVKLEFWEWENQEIPLSNYVGWFVIAYVIQLCYRKLNFKKQNPLNLFILINLILFFAILSFIL